jgi:hypothetical protein
MRDHLAWSGFGFKVLVREEDAASAHAALATRGDKLVLVQEYATQDEADIAQGSLLSAGITATLQDDSATGWRPDVPWTGSGFRVLVREEDVAKARELLQARHDASA